jgi:DNA processing protein
LLVVSGNAAGVDETAHRAALDADGHTALVLPEGILRFRPRSSIGEMLAGDNAVIVSEFSPKLPWSVQNAMQRNRTICGLVHALIVIEAGTSGGTWEAGQAALSLGVPLFVLDYADPAPSGKGNPLLLRKGGRPLPCRPGESPDLTLLLHSLDLTVPKAKSVQPTLFDHLANEA